MQSFVVIGLGRFGGAVAMELYRLGHEVLAIDEDGDNVQRVSDYVTHAMVGDARDEATLKSLGVRNFDCGIVAIADDIQSSIMITIMLKELGLRQVVCKAQDEMHGKVLEKLGADRIVFPERDMGKKLAQSLASKNIIDYIELSKEYSIVELASPSVWADKTLGELNIRARHGITVLAVRSRDRKHLTVSPNADHLLRQGDVLISVGLNKAFDRLRSLKD